MAGSSQLSKPDLPGLVISIFPWERVTGPKQGKPKVSKSAAARHIQLVPQNRIAIDPAVCNGKPTIRGMRIAVRTVLEYLSAGESQEKILRQFPMPKPEDISACLSFAGER